MKILISIILFMLISLPVKDFKSDQLKFPRVRQAYAEKQNGMLELLGKKGIRAESLEIFLRVFKEEQVIELWGRNKSDRQFVHLKDYKFCDRSGTLGPKRKQGDDQTPEGFYYINTFNPNSNFYLSLGINYPNQSDRISGEKGNLGGDIFIHGNCVTIGCIPIMDDKIKELYILAVEACNNGQEQIPVHIFPANLNDFTFKVLQGAYAKRQDLISFWQNLKEGFDYFEKNKTLPAITVLKNGSYHFE